MRGRDALALGLFLLQGGHVFEHALQSVQHYAWGQAHAHGLLGQHFESDWVHFLFNGAMLAGLALVARPAWRVGGWRAHAFAAGILTAVYHQGEHTLKLLQSQVRGDPVSHGFLGYYFDQVGLHLAFNSVVWLMPAPALVTMAWHAYGSRRGLLAQAAATVVPGPVATGGARASAPDTE